MHTLFPQYTGTTDYAKTQFDMLLDQCLEEAEKYDFISVNSSSNDYENPYTSLLLNVCPSDCNGGGICENGNVSLWQINYLSSQCFAPFMYVGIGHGSS